MKKILSLLLAVAMLFSLAIPAFAEEAEEETPVTPYTVPADVEGKIVILHTNDVHGAVENYAKVATLKKMFADAGAEVLLVDAGDFSQGETYVSTSQGASAIELMNLVGYEVAAPGNHEFDYGYENLKELEKLAEFPILAANIKFDGKLAFGDHVVVEKGGKKIGIFGLDTPETATKAHPAKIKGVTFDGGEELYAVAKAEVEALKAEKVDLIVCLSHLGIDDESAANGNRSIDMLAKVEGIDLLIDGHSHSTLEKMKEVTDGTGKVGETVVTSTGTKIENVGVVIIDADKNITTENVPVEAITDTDETVAEALMAFITEKLDGVVGETYAAPQGRITAKYVGLDAGKWFTAAAKNVIDKGLMSSTGNGFDADATVTRGTMVQVLYNMEGKPEVNNKMATFPDAQGKWYENAVRWAEQVGITQGNGAGAFNGEAVVTRAELVVFLNRYAEVKGNTVTAEVNLLDYADGENLTEWSIPAFEWAVGAKVIAGKADNRLAPGETATRAELAQILTNYTDFFAPAAQ